MTGVNSRHFPSAQPPAQASRMRPPGTRAATIALAATGLAMLAPLARAQHPARAAERFGANDALDVVGQQISDLSSDGRWLAAMVSTRRDALGVDYRRDGDPSYLRPGVATLKVIDTRSGEARSVFADRRAIRAVEWSPDGSRLGMLVRAGEVLVPMIWTRASGAVTTARIGDGRYVAENSELRWTSDGKALVFAVHTEAWRRRVQARFDTMTRGPVFVQSSAEPFLAWEALRRQGNVRALVRYDLANRHVTELVPESPIASWTLTPGDSLVAYSEDITAKTDYDVIFGTENRLVVRSTGGATRVLLPSLKGTTLLWSENGGRLAYAKDGRIFVRDVTGGESRQIAGPAPRTGPDSAAKADTSKAAREARARERFALARISPSGDAVVATNSQGIWLIGAEGAQREMIAETGDSTSTGPKLAAAAWSGDGRYLYLTTSARSTWERGYLRYDRTARRLEPLMNDARLYGGLRLASAGDVAVLSVAEGNRPADLYTADLSLAPLRRLTDANPSLDSTRLGRSRLVRYLDADGRIRNAVVYLPVGYREGQRYPTVFNVYEEFFDDTFDATIAVLNANGYVVVRPSVGFDIGYPGEAWIKGVTAAANKLIEMGIADSARLGVHGTSYGGYAVNLLITQTNRFKAAINISGKVDLISFYTDSPRLGVRNIHAAEKSQDRLGATLWEQPQKYVQQSAVMFADRIRTPLLLLTGAQDSNVPADNTREMFYAMRRLGKTVTWVNYMNGGHGAGNATAEDVIDYHRRILDWYDRYLKGETRVVGAGM